MQVGVSIPNDFLDEIKQAKEADESLSAYLLDLIERGWDTIPTEEPVEGD